MKECTRNRRLISLKDQKCITVDLPPIEEKNNLLLYALIGLGILILIKN